MSSAWWDEVLCGAPCTIPFAYLGTNANIGNVRALIYREAANRGVYVSTALDFEFAYVHAYGPQLPQKTKPAPSRIWEHAQLAPTPQLRDQARKVTLAQAAAVLAELRTQQAAPAPTSAIQTVDVDDDDLTSDELLGPCTCGQDPTCLPSCARFN